MTTDNSSILIQNFLVKRNKNLKYYGGIMFKKILTVIISFLLISLSAFAQTGKITGKVTDSQTGEPLIGANILILNTTFGAATNVEGKYTINFVPPGNYDLKASYIGYQDVTIENIRVVSGLTQEVNFEMPSQSIATEEVVIISERPLIEKSSTNAVRIIDSEVLETLPSRELDKIVSLQPGVVLQNDLITIRGSRPDETGYLLEGADVKNVLDRDGGTLITLTPDAVQELLVQAGGYNAEYGNANAGIIQSNLKTGKENYKFSLRAESDNFGGYPGDTFLDTYSYGYSDYVFTMSGPLLTDKVKVFLSGENYFVRDFAPMFFDGNPGAYSDGTLFSETKVFDTGALGGNPDDSQILTWQGGNIPGRFQNRYTFNGTALIDVKPLVVKFSSAFTWQRQRFNFPNVINLFNQERLPITDNSELLLNMKGTYLIADNIFLEGNVNYLDQRRKTYDPNFEDNLLAYSDSLLASQFGWQYAGYTSQPAPYDFYGFPFLRPGTLIVGNPLGNTIGTNTPQIAFTKDKNNYIGGSLALTAQLKEHEVKAGGSFQRWTVRRYQITGLPSILSNIRLNPDNVRNNGDFIAFLQNTQYAAFNNFGYDLFGNETEQGLYAPKHPIFISGYVQDKFETEDIIINGGLRFDYINMDSWAFIDPTNPKYDETTHLPIVSTEEVIHSFVSPRLGFSFPISDRTVFHMQYGRFVQSPSLDVAYRGPHQSAQQLIGGFAFLNPIAYNPEPIKTTQYEIGFSQQFADFAAFDITAFYKDINGQLVYAFQPVVAGAQVSQYPVFKNQDFATTKGVEFSLKIRRVERVRAEINYTFSDSRGTNSFAASAFGSVQVNNNVPTVIIPLDYDQTHRGSISIDYRFLKGDGGPVLENSGINLLLTFNSGHPYTLAQPTSLGQSSAWTGGVIAGDTRQRRPAVPMNSSSTPWVYNIDFRIDKTVTIATMDLNFYIYVQNLLNTRNVINVYDQTGNGYDDSFLSSGDAANILAGERYTERFADLYSVLNLSNRQHYLDAKGYDVFSLPRQIRAGILMTLDF
jgi:hypothetical protein